MLIVGGWFEVDPSERDAFIASRMKSMETSRAEDGNLDYVIAADPVDPARVVLFERWDSQAALDAHAAALREARSNAPVAAPKSTSVQIYDVAGARPLV